MFCKTCPKKTKGKRWYCDPCRKRQQRLAYERWYGHGGKEWFRKYIRLRQQQNPLAAALKNRKSRAKPQNRIHIKKYFKQWYQANGKLLYERKKRRLQSDPEFRAKEMARRKSSGAIKYGKLPKLPCRVCKSKTVEGHHPDYSKPLKIWWLCKSHHALIHAKHNPLVLK